jgi:hypothetical protein
MEFVSGRRKMIESKARGFTTVATIGDFLLTIEGRKHRSGQRTDSPEDSDRRYLPASPFDGYQRQSPLLKFFLPGANP